MRKFRHFVYFIILLIIALYLFLTSNFFLTKIIAPGIGHFIFTNFKVERAAYNPFSSELELHNVTVGDKDNPFLVGKDGTCHVDLLALFDLRLKFSDIRIDGLNINFVKDKRGKWSIPWLYLTGVNGEWVKIFLDFPNARVQNLNLKYKDEYRKNPLAVELNNLTLSSNHFRNEHVSWIKFCNGKLKTTSGGIADVDKGDVNGMLGVTLDSWCVPSYLKVSSFFKGISGVIRNQKFTENLNLNAEIKRQGNDPYKYDINYIKIKGDTHDNVKQESRVNIAGKLFISPFKLLMTTQANPVQIPMLSYLGGLFGNYNVGGAKASYRGNLDWTYDELKSRGELSLFSPASKKENQEALEPIDFLLHYDFDLSFDRKMLLIRRLNSYLKKGDKQVVTVKLDKAFTHYYKQTLAHPKKKSSVIDVDIKDVDLRLLNGVIGDKLRFASGVLNSMLKLSLNPDNDFVIGGKTTIRNFLLEGPHHHGCKAKTSGPEAVKINGNNSYFSVKPLDFDIKNKICFKIDHFHRYHINNAEFLIRLPKDKGARDIDLVLVEPATFIFTQNKLVFGDDIKFSATSGNIHIKDFLKEVSIGPVLKLDDGYLMYNLNFDIPKDLNALKVNGQIELLYMNLRLFGQPIKNVSISNTLDSEFYDSESLKFNNSIFELYVNGVQGLQVKADGLLAFNRRRRSNFTIYVEDATKFLSDFISPGVSKNIKDLSAKGKLNFGCDKQGLSLGGNLNFNGKVFDNKGSGRHSTISGNLDYLINDSDTQFSIEKLNLSLNKNEEDILNLKTSGIFPTPLKNSTSNLSINSDRIALKEISDLYKKLRGNQTQGTLLPKKEYSPVDLNGLDLDCIIDLNNVTYGKLIKSKLKAELNIKNNKIFLHQDSANINGTDIAFQGYVDPGRANGFPFKFGTQFQGLDQNPFIETFVPGDYKNAKGTIDSLNMFLEGKGFTKKNLKKNLKGELKMKLSDLSLPYQIEKYRVLRIMLIPLEMLGKLRELLPGGLLISNLEKGVIEASNIFSNLDNLNLASGEILLAAKKGKVYLETVRFEGDKGDVIKHSDFFGTIDYDGNVAIKTKSNISGILLPLDIDGTLDEPYANLTTFFPKFLTFNAMNILNPITLFELLVDTGEGITKTIQGTGEVVVEPFINNDNVK